MYAGDVVEDFCHKKDNCFYQIQLRHFEYTIYLCLNKEKKELKWEYYLFEMKQIKL